MPHGQLLLRAFDEKAIKEIYDDGKIIQGHGGLGSRE
jgi:hypothetical protein